MRNWPSLGPPGSPKNTIVFVMKIKIVYFLSLKKQTLQGHTLALCLLESGLVCYSSSRYLSLGTQKQGSAGGHWLRDTPSGQSSSQETARPGPLGPGQLAGPGRRRGQARWTSSSEPDAGGPLTALFSGKPPAWEQGLRPGDLAWVGQEVPPLRVQGPELPFPEARVLRGGTTRSHVRAWRPAPVFLHFSLPP